MKLTEYKSVKTELANFENMSGFIANLIIDSVPIAQKVSDNIYLLKQMIKGIDEQRKEVTVPMDLAKKNFMRQFHEAIDPIQKAIDLMNGKLTTYQIEIRRQEAEEQRMLQQIETERLKEFRDEQIKQAEEAQSELAMSDAIATQGIINVVANIEIKGSGVVKETTGLSTSYLVDHFVFRVKDISKVPAMYMILNESLVNRNINGKGRIEVIEGLLIINEPRRRTRGR